MKLCLAAFMLLGSVVCCTGCSTDSTPSKPESFAPLPSAAPGASGSQPAGGKMQKNDNKAAAPAQPSS